MFKKKDAEVEKSVGTLSQKSAPYKCITFTIFPCADERQYFPAKLHISAQR